MSMIQRKKSRDMMTKKSQSLLLMTFTPLIVKKYRLNETFRVLCLMLICLQLTDKVSITWKLDPLVKRPYLRNHSKRPKLSFLRSHMSPSKCLSKTIAISTMTGSVRSLFKDFDKLLKIKRQQQLNKRKSGNRKSKNLLLLKLGQM